MVNFSWKIRVFWAALSLTLGQTGAVSAAGVPEDGALVFDIVRNDEAIGTHTYRFDRSTDRTEVRIKTEINFRLFFIPVYRFEHESTEVWQDGKLSSLESITNENGTPVRIQVYQVEDALIVQTADGNFPVNREIIPASLWNRLILDRNQTLATISGNLKKFKVQYMGAEELKVRGKKVATQHFRLTGEFERELWYDKNDVLVGVRFEASDGSTVAYILK